MVLVYPVQPQLVCGLPYVAQESISSRALAILVYVTETKMDSKRIKTRDASVLIAAHKNL
jgi:hypothetical protein